MNDYYSLFREYLINQKIEFRQHTGFVSAGCRVLSRLSVPKRFSVSCSCG